MMQDWNAYRDSLVARIGDYAQQSPTVMQALSTLSGVVEQGGHLTPKMHELIALAVAVTTRCDGCIAVHTKKSGGIRCHLGGDFRGVGCCHRTECGRGADLFGSCA